MRSFKCSVCGQLLFFDNSRCLRCGSELGYEPTSGVLDVIDDGTRDRQCANRRLASCNWLVPVDDPGILCTSCRLTTVRPNDSEAAALVEFADAETAKRRLIHQLNELGLDVVGKEDDPERGVAFEFRSSSEEQVMTGHDGGVITLDLSESDDAHRERVRQDLGEPYRTVLGHLRHEIGHYYWDLLVRDSDWLPRFRGLFGDERTDYALALQSYYDSGPQLDWPERFISGYAAAHPWEDWAESWAHYLHLRATLQTVESFSLDTSKTPFQITPFEPDALYDPDTPTAIAFLGWINTWVVLTTVLNETARSMGQPDVYPFVMNRAAVTKLHFVQCVVEAQGGGVIVPPSGRFAVA